ncbi:MAG: hypothetical protein SF182_29350 [Deltaproteobacteria bacterium]|nr:hypothetical protein [Deltaproteobacteria bacterium]
MTHQMRAAVWLATLTLAGAAAAQPSGPDGNLPLPAPQLQQRLQRDDFEIDDVEKTQGGIMTTAKLELDFHRPELEVDAKWKAANKDADGWNNSPRREIGAYAVQQLFLSPDDYVVPPVVLRCIPLDVYRRVDAAAEPTLPPHPCVLGTLSAWLHNVTEPKVIFEPERFSRDPRYAYHFGNLNLLAYLIAHRDRRSSNFLVSTDALNPQFFSVDNGIAFGEMLYNYLNWHFDQLAVKDLPRQAVERLRAVTPADLAALGVLVELQPDAAGVLRSVPPGANADPRVGVRTVGGGLQIGLTADEISAVDDRRRALLERIDQGKAGEF